LEITEVEAGNPIRGKNVLNDNKDSFRNGILIKNRQIIADLCLRSGHRRVLTATLITNRISGVPPRHYKIRKIFNNANK